MSIYICIMINMIYISDHGLNSTYLVFPDKIGIIYLLLMKVNTSKCGALCLQELSKQKQHNVLLK